jgi:hypothetical protein
MQEFVEREVGRAAYAAVAGGERSHCNGNERNKKAGVGSNTFHGKIYNWKNLLWKNGTPKPVVR